MNNDLWTFIAGYLLAAISALVIQALRHRHESAEWLRKEKIQAHVQLSGELEALIDWAARLNFRGDTADLDQSEPTPSLSRIRRMLTSVRLISEEQTYVAAREALEKGEALIEDGTVGSMTDAESALNRYLNKVRSEVKINHKRKLSEDVLNDP